MRHFSIRPTLTMKGRKFNGPRGWNGKPLHPPLTDIPIAGYIFAAVFDVIAALGRHNAWAGDFFRAGTFIFVGSVIVSVFTALTGVADWYKGMEAGTQARRTANTHAVIMITVTVLAIINTALRLNVYNTRGAPTILILILSLVIAGAVSIGASFGGTLVFDYGFNVETAGDSPVWHVSEIDHFPGQPDAAPAEEASAIDGAVSVASDANPG